MAYFAKGPKWRMRVKFYPHELESGSRPKCIKSKIYPHSGPGLESSLERAEYVVDRYTCCKLSMLYAVFSMYLPTFALSYL